MGRSIGVRSGPWAGSRIGGSGSYLKRVCDPRSCSTAARYVSTGLRVAGALAQYRTSHPTLPQYRTWRSERVGSSRSVRGTRGGFRAWRSAARLAFSADHRYARSVSLSTAHTLAQYRASRSKGVAPYASAVPYIA
eukprot:1481671-Rhodomonas_salina.3